MTTEATRAWKTDGPLNKALILFLPAFTDDPFGTGGELKVDRLKDALNKSHEAIYKWLRQSKLTPQNAKAIVELAATPDNLKALSAVGRQPPELRDFDQFVFGN